MALFPPVRDSLVVPGKLWTTDLSAILLERDYAIVEGPLEFEIEQRTSPLIDNNDYQTGKSVAGIFVEFPLPWRPDPSFTDWQYFVVLTVEMQENQSIGQGDWNVRLGPESGNWGESIDTGSYFEFGGVNGAPLPGQNDTWGDGTTGAWQKAIIGCTLNGIPYGPCEFKVEFRRRDILESAEINVQRPIDIGYTSYIGLRRI